MASIIKSTRRSIGMSVNELARRLGVTPSAISQLERSEADGTIKLNSLRDALAAMGATLRMTAGFESTMTEYAPYKVAETLADTLLHQKDHTFALRLLTQATQELNEHPEAFEPTDLEIAPTPLPDRRWDTLMRALYARSFPKHKPAWVKPEKLAEPWFVSQFPSLQERAKKNTSEDLRRLNIFIDERSLSRA